MRSQKPRPQQMAGCARSVKHPDTMKREREREAGRSGGASERTDHREVFSDFLRRKGLKLTRERKLILEEVFTHHGHFDIDDLYFTIRGKGLRVSKSSIYRTIPLLLESGLVEEVKTVERQAHYEHTYGHRHHDHLVCISCGRVIEFHSPEIERLQETICRRNRFRSVRHVLEIQGYCRGCNGEG